MKNKIIFLITFIAFIFSSCDKFLEEDFYSASSIETQVVTEDGFETLINACYATAKVWYGKEYGWDLTIVGTDCWTYAGDADVMQQLATYATTYGSQWPGRIGVVWAELYKGLNTCNTAITNIGESAYSDEKKLVREGEVRFLRAFYLWHIVESWGNVAFSNEPITEPEYELYRADVDVFYTQIFEDLDFAIENLPETVSATDYGRVHKYAALAFRARANLYWASEYMSGNSFDGKTYAAIEGRNHIQQAIDDADAVITSPNYELYTTFSDVWDMELNTTLANENTENIWAINYSYSIYAEMNVDPGEYDAILSGSDPKPFNDREGGNQGHMMFGMRWFSVGSSGNTDGEMVKDDDIEGTSTEPTRPFCRYMPTKFLIDLYNTNVDQRYYGSFNNVFYANNSDTSSYKAYGTTETMADGSSWDVPVSLAGQKIVKFQDTAWVFYKDETLPKNSLIERGNATTPYYISRDKGYYVMDQTMMYNPDGSIIGSSTYQRRWYFDLSKWYDYGRPHNGTDQSVVGSQRGARDFVVFRLSEMYLIKAEANLLANNSGEAYSALEDLADTRSTTGNGADMLAAYGVNSGSDLVGDNGIEFILDERAREFAGEQQRWFDLKRTGKTLERIREHNLDAAPNIEEKHIIRPIPQTELDAIENKDDYESGPGIY